MCYGHPLGVGMLLSKFSSRLEQLCDITGALVGVGPLWSTLRSVLGLWGVMGFLSLSACPFCVCIPSEPWRFASPASIYTDALLFHASVYLVQEKLMRIQSRRGNHILTQECFWAIFAIDRLRRRRLFKSFLRFL